jgi:hypothetical protein
MGRRLAGLDHMLHERVPVKGGLHLVVADLEVDRAASGRPRGELAGQKWVDLDAEDVEFPEPDAACREALSERGDGSGEVLLRRGTGGEPGREVVELPCVDPHAGAPFDLTRMLAWNGRRRKSAQPMA